MLANRRPLSVAFGPALTKVTSKWLADELVIPTGTPPIGKEGRKEKNTERKKTVESANTDYLDKSTWQFTIICSTAFETFHRESYLQPGTYNDASACPGPSMRRNMADPLG